MDCFDWIVDHQSWEKDANGRQRLELDIALFLEKSGIGREDWSYALLGWRCEQLAYHGCWYDLNHNSSEDKIILIRES